MKFFKKAVSAFLASIMCIPAGIVNIANAEENDTNTVATVTLSDSCNNGIMQFSQECMDASTANQDGYHMVQVGEDGELDQIENDGSIWAFSPNDHVEIELIPDDGYNVKSFTVKSADTGDVMAHKETMDNVFSFVMPAKSLTVEAVFSDSSTIEIVQGQELSDGGELDVESKYHDITETSEVTQEEVEEVIFDLATESYIKANLNPAYMTVSDKIRPVDALLVKQSMFDGRYVKEGDSINSIMNAIEEGADNWDEEFIKFIGQVQGMSYIYDFDENSDYYVAYANTMQKDKNYAVKDWQFGYNDTTGRLFDGCVYDENTGLLYIPKSLYKQLNEEENDELSIISLQIQFMQVYYDKKVDGSLEEDGMPDMESGVVTVSADEEGNSIDVDSETQDPLAMETVTTVEPGMDPNNMTVTVNGIIMPENNYEYDADTGSLTIGISSAAVVSVEAHENGESLKEKLVDMATEDANAVSYDSMASLTTITINNKDKLPKASNTQLFKPIRVKGTLGYLNNAPGATGKEQNYIPSDDPYVGPASTEAAGIRLGEYILGDKTLAQADISPHKIGPGSNMYIILIPL